MPVANICATAVGLFIAAFGVLGLWSPAILLELGKALQATGGIWLLAFIRVVCGAILLWAAPNSRTPRILIGLGILIIIVGLALPTATPEELAEVHRAIEVDLAAGKIRPKPGLTLPLAEAAKAHELLGAQGKRGQVVLLP